MQGYKKQADGQSDSSSIGSLLDDTDREVCSLTDRAFKSLCTAELETSSTHLETTGSSNLPHQFSSKFLQGQWNHAIKKNTDFHKQLSKKERSTFLLSKVSKNSKIHEERKSSINNSPNITRKLDLPLSDPHHCTHISKVSSLIKTFDKVDNQVSLLLAKQPVKNSLTECPFIYGDTVAFWGDETILNIRKGISDTCQIMANSGNQLAHKGYNKMDLAYQTLYPFQANASNIPKSGVFKQMVKNRTGKVEELDKKGSFLHSENSAFESWNAHHKKLREMGEVISKDDTLTYFEETPFFKKPYISEHMSSPHKLIGPFILEQSSSDTFPQKSFSKASLSSASVAHISSLANAKDTIAQVLLPQVSAVPVSIYRSPTPTSKALFPPRMTPPVRPSPVPVSKAPIPTSSLPQTSFPPEAAFPNPDTQKVLMPQITSLAEKMMHPEFVPKLGNDCPPPWRKQKALGRMKQGEVTAAEMLPKKDSSYRNSCDANALVETSGSESHISLSEQSNSSFSISTLLTPVIPLKQKNEEPSENQLLELTPPLSDIVAMKESEEKTLYSQSNYKSKAPRLLFNLKDIRKRVKSTYSPSPLLRVLEDKSKRKEQINGKANVTVDSVLEGSNKKLLGGVDEVNKPEQIDSIPEKDNTANFRGDFMGGDLMQSLSKSRADILNKNHLWQRQSTDTENYELISEHEHHERQPSPSPNPYLTNLAAVQQEGTRGSKHEKVTSSLDNEEASINLLLTAEGTRSNHENQTCLTTGSEHRGKRSTSSSEQSFVSTAEQPFNEAPFSLMRLFQKACLQESQRRKDDMAGWEKLSSKEKEESETKETRNYLLNNCDFNTEERGDEWDENEDVPQEVALKETQEDRWKNMDCEPESKPEDSLTSTSNSFKPNLFMIKDNTFKAPTVIKAIKLPLLRSMSCEDATPNTLENPRNAIIDRDGEESRSIPGNMGCQRAEESNLTSYSSFREGLESFHVPEMVGNYEASNILSVEPEKELAIAKGKIRVGKLRPSSAIQSNLGFESQPRQKEQREKINYVLSKQISQESKSPITSKNETSPVSSDAFGYTSTRLINSATSTKPSPRSDDTAQTAFTSPLSDTTTNFSVAQTEKIANSSPLKGTENIDMSSITLMFNPVQACQLPGDADSSPVANERLQLMSQMARKPPTVPPKTEKALRKAKKLANRRKKIEAQQKKLQDEPMSQSGEAVTLPSVQSPRPIVSPNSPLTSPKSNLMKQQPISSLCPIHSLSPTQRKLLQDPDSGEYYIVDLPIQLKTFYDPDSGKYIRVSVPSFRRNVSQTPSPESSLSAYGLSPSILSPRVASVPALPSPSHLSGPALSMQALPLDSAPDGQPSDQSPESFVGPPCVDSAAFDIQHHDVDGPACHFQKDTSPSATAENISMGSPIDFVVDGIL